MVNKCPNCGEEIKKDFKFCLSCGHKLTADEQAISKTEAATSPVEPTPKEPTTPVPPPQQPVSQHTQIYLSSGQKFPIKIIGLLIGIIIIVVVVVVILMMLGGASGPLVGEWETTQSGFTMGVKLNGDYSLEMSYGGSPYIRVGSWEEKGSQLCMTISGDIGGMELPGGSECYAFEISEDGRTMTWSASGYTAMTWTKK